MRLKSLEIKGFKSFANETVVHFNERVTGVVGPNGSGKSNIVDAIRWVLGDQSAKELRLDKMSSVIFNGSRKRKPAGMAQVTITFDNTRNLLPTEYSTVGITRVLYRSGESEYKINGVTCRLKDIHSLLMDTGIGSDSYAIIALGMVDDILSDKENSRRRMLEQAAGISKYKLRKKETFAKLKSTSEDLERVQDLLFEIEKNMKMLERQAKRAEKYLLIKTAYKEKSITLAGYKTKSFHRRIAEISGKIEHEMQLFSRLEADLNVLEAQLEKQRKDTLDKERNLSDAQKIINRIVGSVRGMENERGMLEQEHTFTSESLRTLLQEIQTMNARHEILEEELEAYGEKLAEAEEREEVFRSTMAEQEILVELLRKEYSGMQSGMQTVLKEQGETEKKVYEIEKNIAVNNNQIINARSEIGRNLKDREAKELEIRNWQTRFGDSSDKVTEMQKRLLELEEEENARQNLIDALDIKVSRKEKDIQSIARSLDAKKNEFKLTKSMIESMEGFPESIRYLNRNMSWEKEVALLSDIIYVEDPGLRNLVENYLENYLNYYVVEEVGMAYAAIEKLSAAQKGKANFFILDRIKTAAARSFPDGYRSLIGAVRVEPMYENLLQMLLGEVGIGTIEQVKDLKVDSVSQFALVSDDGTMLSKGASLGGGSVGLFEGKKIGRKKNLEILNRDISAEEILLNEYSRELKLLTDERVKLKGGNNAQAIQQARRELQSRENENIQLKTRLENASDFLKVIDGKQEDVQEKILNLQADNEELQENLFVLRSELQEILKRIEAEDTVVRQKADKLTEVNQNFNTARIEFIRQQNLCETYRKEIGFRRSQMTELERNINTNTNLIGEKEQKINIISTKILELQEQLKEAYRERKEKESSLSAAEQDYYGFRSEIHESENKIRELNKKRNDAQSLINGMKEKRNEIKFELATTIERVSIEFNLDTEFLRTLQIEENIVLLDLETDIKTLRSRLESFGEVNPLAVDAYNEIKSRYDEILGQRDDILKAKEDLEQTIKEIEDTATSQFLSAFNQVRQNFITVFRSLFTEEDDCDMKLENPAFPLESNIIITAKPKGKKPQSLSQLSGGEKTLTATALLFALYLLKPAPFCIFDEVDAPLDDANIEKFNKIIKKFSQESQFIIITHNKLTMTEVDVIYGVYMEDMGISAVSPVDFRSFEHQAFMETAALQ